MNINDILNLISQGETRYLELKKTTGELKDAMHTACAFLNTDGGFLVFGVTPTSLKLVGQQVTDNTRQEIAQALSHFEPALDLRVEYVDIPEQPHNQIIVMKFDGWDWGKEPYTYHGCPYYKVESTTLEMPRDMFIERLKACKPDLFSWERQTAIGMSISDLSEKHIMDMVRMGVRGGRMPESALSITASETLYNFNLLKDGKPLNAAVMLFTKHTRDYPQLRLRMARFAGTDRNTFIDNQQASGNFAELLDTGMAFCFKHLNLSGEVIGLHRVEHLDIPVEALREALVNALCHRSYEQSGTSIGLAIYDDRVEIENPGRFPSELTPETIKLPHKSHPYNQLIADVLYKSTWLENWGTGVARMISFCKAQNLPEPYYEITNGFVTIVFPRQKISQQNNEKHIEQGKTTKLTDRQTIILQALKDNGMETIQHLAKTLGVTPRTIERDISTLRANGLITKESKSSHSPWVVLKKDK